MRKALDALYDAAGALAGLCMVGLLAMVMLSIVSRQLHFHVPGTDAYAGYLMAGAGFLALAQTLKHGEHIRVTLILSALHGRTRHALEVWALFAASLLAVLFSYYACRLSWQSHLFHDISTSSDATPLWLPQIAMAVGSVVLAIAFIMIPGFSRVVRASVLSVKQNLYIEAARALGQTTPRILLHHVLPNVAAPIIVVATGAIGSAILAEASLSFLGLGPPPPNAGACSMCGRIPRSQVRCCAGVSGQAARRWHRCAPRWIAARSAFGAPTDACASRGASPT